MQPLRQRQPPAYCYCSELAHAAIVQQQQQHPLPFEQAMRTHCRSAEGCGRCLWPLEQAFRAAGCFYGQPGAGAIASGN